MSGLKRLIHEIHRRSLWQVLGIYVAVSWAVFQVVQTLTEGLGLPDWVPPYAFVLLLIGFPIVLATAFVQEGLSPTRNRDPTLLPTPEATVEAQVRTGSGARRLFTWRNAIAGGVLAFAVLGVLTAGYMAMRVLGIGPVGSLVAQGALDAREPIVLAEFENRTNTEALGVLVAEALRIDLSQSPFVKVAEPALIAQALGRMSMEPGVPLDLALAREVAIREGLKAVIGGEVGSAGASYLISATLVSAESGELLAGFRETADDSTAILRAVDRLSKKLRERVGESLKTIRQSQPLEQVTTSSLRALRKYTEGWRTFELEGDYAKSIGLLHEALALDTAFAAAYRKLGVAYGNIGGHRSEEVEALTQAFQHRDRLTDRERYITEAFYYSSVTGEREKAITAYETMIGLYPDDPDAPHNLALLYGDFRDYARAKELLQRAIELAPEAANAYLNLAYYQVALGRFEQARETLEQLAEVQPEHPWLQLYSSRLASAGGDYDEAEKHALALRESQIGNLYWRARTSGELANLAKIRGHLAVAERHLRDAMATNEERRLAAAYVGGAIALAEVDVRFRGAPDRGLEQVEEALRQHPLDSIAPLDRPYLGLGFFYARAGQPERARDWLSEYEARIDASLRRPSEPILDRARGVIALADRQARDAIELFRRADKGACAACILPYLGRAYDLAGAPDSTIAIYERYLTTPWLHRLALDANYLGLMYERLAALYGERGDSEKAIYYYGKLVELWKEADPELQPRVEAARRAISALSPDS